jgi:hypothetical protein
MRASQTLQQCLASTVRRPVRAFRADYRRGRSDRGASRRRAADLAEGPRRGRDQATREPGSKQRDIRHPNGANGYVRTLRHGEQVAEGATVVAIGGVMSPAGRDSALGRRMDSRYRAIMVMMLAPQHLVQTGADNRETRVPAQQRKCGESSVHGAAMARMFLQCDCKCNGLG